MALVDQARADGGAGIVAAAGDDGRADGQAGDAALPRGHVARHFRALEHIGQQAFGHLQRLQHLAAVAPLPQVEEQRARGVGGIGRVAAGQPQADEVLGQHQLREAGRGFGLMAPQPQQLGRLEAGAGAVAGDRDHPLAAEAAVDLVAFGVRAGVVPEQGRADRLAIVVQEYRAVHLPGQPDRGDGTVAGGGREPQQDVDRGPPPVLGLLLGPARSRRQQRIAGAGPGAHRALGREQRRPSRHWCRYRCRW